MMVAQHSIDGSNAALPQTMAGLLEVAINDARKLDRSIYLPFHNEWHNPNAGSFFCEICLAGSVIAGSLKIAPNLAVSSLAFDKRTEELLDALDNMRYGHWSKAFDLIYNRIPSLQIRDYLQALPEPAHSEFDGWEDFDLHLASLERMLPQLRSIDRAVERRIKSRF